MYLSYFSPKVMLPSNQNLHTHFLLISARPLLLPSLQVIMFMLICGNVLQLVSRIQSTEFMGKLVSVKYPELNVSHLGSQQICQDNKKGFLCKSFTPA